MSDPSDLMIPYVPTLVELADPPRLEYVTKDVACIYNPVDERFCYITDMETRKIIGFQFMLPSKPKSIFPERREFSLAGTGFTLRECGCSIGLCDGSGVKDGTCRVAPVGAPTREKTDGGI